MIRTSTPSTSHSSPVLRRTLALLLLAPLCTFGAARAEAGKLTPPASGEIRVAVALAPWATVIDFTGPWEVFQDTQIGESGSFELYTVAESRDPVTASGGLKLVPDYTFSDAPQPHVIVIPALRGSEELREWLRRASREADVVMSVCTGAFELARAGLLDGLMATTHHLFLDQFEKEFPKVHLKRGVRFVENEKFSSAAGLTSGIDLALRVVERYHGREVAERTAKYMEHASEDWKVGGSSSREPSR